MKSDMSHDAEMVGYAFRQLAYEGGVRLMFIQPGKPNQNAFAERFNRTFRHEVLNTYLFETMWDVGQICDEWRNEYNKEMSPNH